MSRFAFIQRSTVVSAALAIASAYLPATARAQTAADDIVLWTSTVPASGIHGDWARITDANAAGGAALQNPNRGRARVSPALRTPTDYFEMTFSAKRATAYHLWIRMRAQSNSTSNDSVHVQFSDSVNASGNAIIRIGTTSSAEPVLQDGTGAPSPQNWGWTDNGWGTLGTPIYFAADGTHVIRIQRREDGPAIDQIVLSPRTFSSAAPGATRNDTTILMASSSGSATPSAGTIVMRAAAAAAGRTFGTWQSISDSTAAGGRALRNPNANLSRISPALANPVSYFEATFSAQAGRPYHVWLRMRAENNSTGNDSVHVQFSDSVTSSGSATARIGSTNSLEVVLQAGSGAPAPSGWGWADNGWGTLGSHIYFSGSGTHTIRIQQREDGVIIDQIVISPDSYLTSPPGSERNDQTILPESQSPPSGNQSPVVSLTAPANGATFTAPASITLSATASDPENRMAKVDFYNGSTLLATDTSAPYSFTWSSVAAGTYQLRAVATDADGGSATSTTATATVSSSASPPPLPSGEQSRDIGAPAVSGSASHSAGTYTVRGAGVDIWNTSDQFHFVYRQVSGDVDIVARVASLQGSNGWSKAGVMIRESLAANARHVFAHQTAGNGYRLMQRPTSGGTASSTSCASASAGWLRLVRRGNTFEMRRSSDGQTWTACATVQVSMTASVYVGLAVGSVDAAQAATGVFTNVSVAQGTANQPPSVTLTAPAAGSTFTALASIAMAATASDPEGRLAKVDFYNGSTLLRSDTSSPFSYTWNSVAAGTYQLRAVATDAEGSSTSSATVTVTVSTTTSTTRRVNFTASVDHAIVTSYLLEVFPSTANPATATPIASSDLGKPTPSSAGEIVVDRTSFLNGLAPGQYLITVASVGTGGRSRSTAISFTR